MSKNRTIHISVGSSRKSTSWHTTETTLGELYERLKQVTRTQETLDTYVSMKKSDQDSLKDVGGFVGGQLDGNRKIANLKGRDLITLDMDHCPANSSEAIEEKLNALGCGYCIYSTRKHQPSAPRLRVVIPTNRTMTVEEYEPVARKMAELIQPAMNWFDPTTFEAVRLMYWPSASIDGEVFYRRADKGLLDVDGMLAKYTDWRDISQWPEVPGVAAKRKSLVKQKDPTTKKGVVGAFCRAYSILAAIENFLPDEYLPAGENRYTYAGGSTSGGAVVYDDLYLYSHHATDPCSGMEVNAFDLVRLHKFGDLDDDAKPGTPANRMPSFVEMMKFAREQPSVKALLDEETKAEMQAAFEQSILDHDTAPAERMQALTEFAARHKGDRFSTGMLEEFLSIAGISVCYNVISHEEMYVGTEVYGIPYRNAPNLLPTWIEDFMRLADIQGGTKTLIADRLDLLVARNQYNPVKEMLNPVLWDGIDRITEFLVDIMGIPKSDGLSHLLCRKWLLQCIAMAYNDEKNPIGADGVLVLIAPQGVGKTSTMRVMAVAPGLFAEGSTLSARDKDTQLRATSAWISELGEMERSLKEDEGFLKAFITAASDKIRVPYARKAETLARHTSFCGTVNSTRFLRDETGNRRFWTVPIEHIDLDRSFSLTEEWRIQLWAQVKEEYDRLGKHSFRLTPEERAALDRRNAKRMEERPGEAELREILDPELDESLFSFVSSTQLSHLIGNRYPAITVGKIANIIIDSGNYPGAKKKRTGSKRGFWLPIAKDITLT